MHIYVSLHPRVLETGEDGLHLFPEASFTEQEFHQLWETHLQISIYISMVK